MLTGTMAPRSRQPSPRERLEFNSGWRFFRGDAPDAGRQLDYDALRPWIMATGTELINEGVRKPSRPAGDPGANVSFVQPSFDDADWRKLDLPHDWGIEGPFDQELPGETGKLFWQGTGWYRKRFRVPKGDAARKVYLDIDGAMAFSAVWLNGHLVGGWPYGYSSFRLDVSPSLRFDADNVLAIRLNNPPDSSRWYPGSGLYRNVWLVKTQAVRVAHWGVFVTTPRVTARAAIVKVDVTVENTTGEEAELTLQTVLHELAADGRTLGRQVANAEPFLFVLPAQTATMRTLCAEVAKPKLWSLEDRRRCVAVTSLYQGKKLLDQVDTPFGIRSVRFDADTGLYLNDKLVPLNGVCLHHDLGALGSAFHVRALERQIEMLQAMGANAIRTSHNPPAPEMLDLCDRMGMLVMDEAFDCWRRGKKGPPSQKDTDPKLTYFDYAAVFDDWHERDLRALVRRDRNHPCVVMWSIGNEVIEQWYPDGWRLASRLAGIVREEDRTRPITSAFNGTIAGYSGFQTALDVVGFNYKPEEYAVFRRRNPTQPVLGSETASSLSSRGEYVFPVSDKKTEGRANFHVSSYDVCAADWALIPDSEWKGLDTCPGAAGEFVWTGFDYLGEPTPYNSDSTNLLNFSDPVERQRAAEELKRLGKIRVPSRSSYFGIIDLAGFPKDRYYLYQARWRPNLKMAHIVPHWNWPERIGQITPVHVYSAGDEAELFLNGKSLGRRRRKKLEYRFRWDDVVYEPGELRVVTYRQGKRWATSTQFTTGPAAGLRLTPDRSVLRADGKDLAFVTVAVTDSQDRIVPRSHHAIRFAVKGPADIVGVDNGDPTDLVSFQSLERAAFNGLAMVLVRTKANKSGGIVVTARAEGLDLGRVALKSAAP